VPQVPLLNPFSKWAVTYILDPMHSWETGLTALDAVDLEDAMSQLLDEAAQKGLREDEVWAISAVQLDPLEIHVGVQYKTHGRALGTLTEHESAVPDSVDATENWRVKSRRNGGQRFYIVSGTVGDDDERFAQRLWGHSVADAINSVTDYFELGAVQPVTPVRVWSVIELGAYRHGYVARLYWMLTPPPGKGTVQLAKHQVVVAPYGAGAGPVPTPGRSVEDDLELINLHRASIYQPPLDPRAAGWGPDDIVAEANRIRRLQNPDKPKLGPRETLLIRWGTPVEGARDEYTDVSWEPSPGHRIGHTWAVTRVLEKKRGKPRPTNRWTLTHFPSGRRALEGVDKYVAVALGQRLVELGYDSVYDRSPSFHHFPGLNLIIGNVRGRLGMGKAELLEYIADLKTDDFGELSQMEFGGYTLMED
jgi:hypothetical protein